jgi:hypothetical protein
MNDPENFLSRWSRRKREAGEEADKATAKPSQQSDNASNAETAVDATPEQPQAPTSETAEPVFDFSTLPSIDSITAETDITAFFAPGVPAELKLAALRRAWVVDPKVRDFVGLADYDWDFHTPGALEGFGPLKMTDEVRREVFRIVGEWRTANEPVATPTAATTPAPTTESEPTVGRVGRSNPVEPVTDKSAIRENSRAQNQQDQDELIGSKVTSQRNKIAVAMRQEQSGPDDLAIPARRSHGRALPK